VDEQNHGKMEHYCHPANTAYCHSSILFLGYGCFLHHNTIATTLKEEYHSNYEIRVYLCNQKETENEG
jgi:hypothetical protein